MIKRNSKNNSRQAEKETSQSIPKIWAWTFNYLLKPSSLGVLVLFGLLLVVLFLPPVIGMGDDGSTTAIISGSNLYSLDALNAKEAIAFFSKNWGIMEYYNDSETSLITSQTPFINAAKRLDQAFSWIGCLICGFMAP